MEALTLKMKHFKDMQAEIMELNRVFQEKHTAIRDEYEGKIKALQEEANAKITEAAKDLQAKSETYKAELKAWVGCTDGEKTNVLDVVALVSKVLETK